VAEPDLLGRQRGPKPRRRTNSEGGKKKKKKNKDSNQPLLHLSRIDVRGTMKGGVLKNKRKENGTSCPGDG